jgi:hypothetical protein
MGYTSGYDDIVYDSPGTGNIYTLASGTYSYTVSYGGWGGDVGTAPTYYGNGGAGSAGYVGSAGYAGVQGRVVFYATP